MLNVGLDKEIVIRRRNEIGALADIARTVAEKGIGIRAVCAWVEGSDCCFRLVVDDALRASDALRAKMYEVREAPVVLAEVPHKPGMLKFMTEKLKEAKIDIHHLYASALSDQARCIVVFACSDNQKAVVLLHKSFPAN